MAYLALFIALGGSSYAAVSLSRNSVRSTHIKNGQVKRADLGRNAVNSSKVGNGSLLAQDFAPGQLPKGEKGDPGEKGNPGTTNVTNRVGAGDSCDSEGCEPSDFAVCQAGETAVSGGFNVSEKDEVTISTRSGNAWFVEARDDENDGDATASVDAIVICASP